MIKIHITEETIKISGHANYANYGHDIVCSAVSSIVTTSINGILAFKETIIVEEEKESLLIKIKVHDKITDTLIKNMIDLLKEVERQYQKNVKIIEEGD
ncbi:MAG: ribosomal-processing cysteine protease Prp [Bacilli bacterium]|nr:ribosomal-processing cysteine protease Prp [Bacilli bacterium]